MRVECVNVYVWRHHTVHTAQHAHTHTDRHARTKHKRGEWCGDDGVAAVCVCVMAPARRHSARVVGELLKVSTRKEGSQGHTIVGHYSQGQQHRTRQGREWAFYFTKGTTNNNHHR